MAKLTDPTMKVAEIVRRALKAKLRVAVGLCQRTVIKNRAGRLALEEQRNG